MKNLPVPMKKHYTDCLRGLVLGDILLPYLYFQWDFNDK